METCNRDFFIQFEMDVLEVSDWIWDIQFLINSSHIAVALGHNSIELWDWRERVLLEDMHCEEKCILYCASFFNSSWSNLVLFAGTVFNQVLLWRPCGIKNQEGRVIPDLRCTGHEGVIFNVQYSLIHKVLCSVSDDRSIRLWSIGSPECPSRPILTDADLVLYGHSARVWAVRLIKNNIISIGEDATCIVWDYEGKILQNFKGHKGRSIWSLTVDQEEKVIATGGGDSSIRLWFLDEASQIDTVVECVDLQGYMKTHDGFVKEDFARSVMLTNSGEVITMTNAGYLLGYHLQNKLWRTIFCDERFQSYGITSLSPSHQMVALGNIHGDIRIVDLSCPDSSQCLNAFESKVLGLCWAEDQHLFSSGPEGQLILWDVSMTANNLTAKKLMMFILPESRQRWITTAVRLPQGKGFLCGDKRGSLHHFVCSNSEIHQPIFPVTTLRGVHGKVGVTDICCHEDHIYSTGRDGTCKEYDLSGGVLQIMNTNRIYKGFEWIEKLIIKENGEIQVLGFHTSQFVVWSVTQNQKLFQVKCGGGHRSWGFAEPDNTACLAYIKAKDVFICKQSVLRKQHILKNSLHGRELTCAKFLGRINVKGESYLLVATGSEDTTVNIVAIDCRTSEAAVVKTLQDHVSSVRDFATCESHTGHMTKMQAGESKSMDSQRCQNEKGDEQKSVLLFSVGGRCSIKCWKLFVQNNAENLSSACTVSLLASYGTLETNQRRKRLKRGQPLDPDTRYMALQVLSAHDLNKSLPHHVEFLTIAASDGVVRVFTFDEMQKTIEMIWSSGWHDVCLLSLTHIIHKLPEGNAALVCSAGTDGRVALWDITRLIYDYFGMVDEDQSLNTDSLLHREDFNVVQGRIFSKELESTVHLLKEEDDKTVTDFAGSSRSDNEKLSQKYGNISEDVPNIAQIDQKQLQLSGASNLDEHNQDNVAPVFWMKIHQSGINAIDLTKKDSGYLIITGGDDNAIHVTNLKVEVQTAAHMHFQVGDPCSAPSAHATHISGLKFLDEQTFISSSIDQRLNTWKICHNNIDLIGSEFTHVADTSGLDTILIEGKIHILIPGQGLQLLNTPYKMEASS
ncbi:WD repeat-containing protein 6-like isoform X2 [Anneissia japonica]|uniref:WD repeat-containing protein 6-like isoform X2 n=1 Tax=Anneissia japonica TaxID=1529436 RepID=UPI001425B325|nr:WD repeat-containing protein 6-like isoform X2 [Anneissia japonica]